MKINEAGLSLIKEFEGLSLRAYKDPVGIYTIGYGHTKGVTQNMQCTMEQANQWLQEDIKWAEKEVEKLMKSCDYAFTRNQFSALTSFTFNCGPDNLTQLTADGTRSVDEIGEKILLYTKAGGKTLPGLVIRREAERALFLRTEADHSDYYPKPVFPLDTIFEYIGVPASMRSGWKSRVSIAMANGIEGYKGTAEQNVILKNLAMSGRLKKP